MVGRAKRSSNSVLRDRYSIRDVAFIRSFTTNATDIGTLRGVYLSPDGTRMYLIGRSPSRYIAQYSLSTAFDISTATYVARTAGDPGSTGPTDLWINSTGTKLYESGSGYDGVYERTFSTAWNITSLSAVGAGNFISYSNMSAMAFDGSGTYLLGGQGSGDTMRGYRLTSAYTITSPTLLGTAIDPGSGVSLSFEGNKMMSANSTVINEYSLSATGNPSSKTLINTKNLQTISGEAALANMSGMHVTILASMPNKNRHLYVVDSTSQKVWQFSLW